MMLRKVPEHNAASAGTTSITESVLLRMSNRALDDLFRVSPSGPGPDGDLEGMLVAFSGTLLATPLAALTRALGWQGKVVSRDSGTLVNKVGPFGLRAVKALVSVDDSWVDGNACVVLDYSRTSFLARMVRDEIRLVGPHLYLGVVWLRHRRVAWFTLREPTSSYRQRRPAAKQR